MNEFFETMAKGLIGFPPILTNILTAGAGAVVAAIIAYRMSLVPMGLGDLVGQFVVCWLTGGILGPALFAPIVQSLVKLPDYAICFLSSGSSWWFWTKYLPKKQDELLNKKDKPGGEIPPGTEP